MPGVKDYIKDIEQLESVTKLAEAIQITRIYPKYPDT